MMNDSYYEIAFELISNAGDSKSYSMMSIEAAREFDFEKAYNNLKIAEKKLHEAHQVQTKMIQQEANGEKVDVNIILVHAQDHLTTAMILKDQADEFLHLYKLINSIIKKK